MPGLSAMTLASMATGATGRPLWPSDLTGLILWLPADQIQGIASGASLSVWTDSSASASHATQPSVASQPIFLTNQRNSLSAVSFGGTAAQYLLSPTSVFDATTFGAVYSAAGAASGRLIGANGSTTRINAGSTSALLARGASFSANYASTTSWISLIAFGDPASSNGTISVNGQSTTTTSYSTSGATVTVCNIGAVTPSSSTIPALYGELVAYNRNLSESERSSLDSYFRTKWAI